MTTKKFRQPTFHLAICAALVAAGLSVEVGASQGAIKLVVPKSLTSQKAASKVNPSLEALYEEYQTWRRSAADNAADATFKSADPLVRLTDGHVVVDAVASGDAELLRADLERLRLKNAAVFGRMVSGQLPISAIKSLESIESLKFIRPAIAHTNSGSVNSLKFIRPATARTNSGSVNSQGDAAMRSDDARTNLGIDGTGVLVGVMADSFDCMGGAAAGVASNDLPMGIHVLQESSNCSGVTDVGRAMMEVIHDVAPGAALAFHRGFEGQADFAKGILDLQNAGANVIVDDIIYLDEPMFQDGIIAQAVDRVVAHGVAYFAPAGNSARHSYESRFRPSGQFLNYGFGRCEAHDFDPGPGRDTRQQIRLPTGADIRLSFQWDQPFPSASNLDNSMLKNRRGDRPTPPPPPPPGPPGAESDLDILLFSGNTIVAGGFFKNIGGDPVEILSFASPGATANFDVAITNCAGPNPRRIKYVVLGNDAIVFGNAAIINEFDTQSGTVFGHFNARGAEAVGAADFLDTPEFGVSPPVIETFSSAGGVPILLNTDGSRKPRQEIRKKPGIVAPDGINNTFFGNDRGDDPDAFPNTFGTTIAAPHAAGVAALILQNNPTFVPNLVYARLRASALDTDAPGFDFNTGFGFIDASLATVTGLPGACQGVPATITGSEASDIIVGTLAPDVIVGAGGNDQIKGEGGRDLICGEGGRDTLSGGTGRDQLFGGSGRDICDGGAGRDTAHSCEHRVSVP